MGARQHWGLAIALGAVVAAAASATVVTIQPSNQDAFIEQDSPHQIFGAGPTNTRIRVQNSPNVPAVWRGLVQFDLSVIPQFSTVNAATLGLYESIGVSPARTHEIHVVNTDWLQSGVNWQNQPPVLAAPSASFTTGAKGFKTLTVTADVQAWVNAPTDNHGWLIRDATETGGGGGKVQVPYHAREENQPGELTNRPKLTVDFIAPPCTTDGQCADSNPCTVNERCVSGHCAVDPLGCDDGNPCTDDICDPAQGCLHPSICNDGFDCTLDICNPTTLACTNTPVDSACTAGGCKVGTCVADPNNPQVDPQTGCVITGTNPNGTPCTDGQFCTDGETCLSGACQGGGPHNCSDNNGCTVDSCDEANDRCVHDPAPLNGTTCDDGLFCTVNDKCQAGTCVGSARDCTDTSACTADSCDEANDRCVHDPAPLNGTACDDGLFCTVNDTCQAGTCVGSARDCADTNSCTADSCDEANDRCVNDPAPLEGSACDDGEFCTVGETCHLGSCQGGTPRVCTDNNACTADTCDEASNHCVFDPAPLNGTPCDDGMFCTVNDVCQGGACHGAARDCSAAGGPCKTGMCDESADRCVGQNQPDGTTCSDGDSCTTADHCVGGVCVPGTADPNGCADDYLCDKVKVALPFSRVPGVHLVDQFEDVLDDVVKPAHLCPPAGQTGGTVHDPVTHLVSYRIRPSPGSLRFTRRTGITVKNEIGQISVDLVRPDLLLVPTNKSLAASPQPPNEQAITVDHYKCYKVRVTPGTSKFPKGLQLQVSDQFTNPAKKFDLKKPRHLCAPVSKDSGGTKNAVVHLFCYLARPARGQPRHQRHAPVFVNNQFGPETFGTIREDELCVPSFKMLPP